MAKSKTATKTATVPTLVPRPDGHGALLTGGMPGNAGGGRPRQELKDFLKLARTDPLAQQALEKAMRDSESRSFASAWKTATEYDDDKPAEKRQIVGPLEVRVRIVAEGRKITGS